tara:strand:+ start:304 stop:1692 length:1389 start_codon:yes stop_codon:yes gene_type:complete
MPTDPKMKMELTPIVYENMRTIGARPSRLQQGLRAVGRGLAIAGGAGVAVGVANSLFNKPSDNYAQSVTNNQTTGGRNTRVGQLDSFDQFFETDNEKYAKTGGLGESSPPSKSTTPAQTVSITDKVENFTDRTQYDSPIGPHSLASATGIGRKPRMAKLGGSEFSQALRYGDPAANIAAANAENAAAYGPQELMGQGGMSISSGEEEDYRRKTGQSLKKYGLTDRTKPERRGQFRTDLILDHDTQTDKQSRAQAEYEASPRYQEEQFRERVSRDNYVPTTTEQVEQFINKTKSGKNLPEKKTPKVSDLGERRGDNASVGMKSIIAAGGDVAKAALEQTPEIDLSEIENDSALADIGRREDPQDVSPRGIIPPDKSGTINKTDLSAIGDIIGEKQADNPIIGGLQGIGKAARIAGKIGKRTVEELADKGAKDRRNYAKYKETIRKAQAFKKIAEDRENTKDSE